MATNGSCRSVFSLFFRAPPWRPGDDDKPRGHALVASAADIMLKVTGYVMNFAPFAVFGAIWRHGRQEGSASCYL